MSKPVPNPEKHIHASIKIALQGLAFWISYRQVLYYEHSIHEATLVSKFLDLLRGKLNNSLAICNESQYEKGKKRTDVEIREKTVEKDNGSKEKCKGKKLAVIEFKRNQASMKDIKNDIEKLIEVKRNEGIPCYLVVTSDKKPPKIFEVMKKKAPKIFEAMKENAPKKNLSDIKFSLKKEIKKYAKFNNFKSTGYLYSKKGNIQKANYCSLLEIKRKIK
ncbi:MAG: hypothetical protein FWH22_09060 [Fibromonadales bacterium]|nr:hypothetical protein [Fibromonadales bacterium]